MLENITDILQYVNSFPNSSIYFMSLNFLRSLLASFLESIEKFGSFYRLKSMTLTYDES